MDIHCTFEFIVSIDVVKREHRGAELQCCCLIVTSNFTLVARLLPEVSSADTKMMNVSCTTSNQAKDHLSNREKGRGYC